MYKLPLINHPVPSSALNIPVGNEKGFMYKLPKIQDSSIEEEFEYLKEFDDGTEAILQQLRSIENGAQSMKRSSTSGKSVSSLMLS